MAQVTSGSFNTSAYVTSSGTKRYLTFSWERTSYSVANNTSTISYTLKGAGNYTGWVNTRNIKLVINGKTVYTAAGPIKVYNNTSLKSGTATINHNSDGAKSFSASVECGIYYSAINGKGSGTWELKSIPRASSVSATNGDIGSTSTITIAKASSSFTHTLTWKCLDLSGTIATKTSATSVSFTVPTSLYKKIPNAKTVKVSVTCESFNGSTRLGTNSCEFTATAEESICKPSVSYTSIEDSSAIAQTVIKNPKIFVKNLSMAKFNGISATANNEAELKSVIVKNGNFSKEILANGTVPSTYALPTFVTSNTFTITATDSRGYSNTVTYTATLHDYFAPTITGTATRIGQTGGGFKIDFKGKYFNGSISTGATITFLKPTASGTTLPVTVATINKDGTVNNLAQSFTLNGTDFSGCIEFNPSGLDYRNEYTLTLQIKDCMQTVIHTTVLKRGKPVFDWGENDFNFNVPIHYKGQAMTEDFVVEQGTEQVDDPSVKNGKVTWTYRKWNSGIAECWATREVSDLKADQSWAIATGAVLYYVAAPEGLPYPFTFTSVPSETAKVGCNNMSGWDLTSAVNTANATGKYSLIRPTKADTTTYTIRIHYHVIGKYKQAT